MATIPTYESILLQVHQRLTRTPYQTSQKEKFAARAKKHDSHVEMLLETLTAIWSDLELDGLARMDSLDSLWDFGGGLEELAMKTWTHQADQRQVLWLLLSHHIVPGGARYIALWTIYDNLLGSNNVGERFWYLPTLEQTDEGDALKLPVQNVIEAVLSSQQLSTDKFVSEKLCGDLDDPTGQVCENITRDLYRWREGTLPTAAKIKEYFPDSIQDSFQSVSTIRRQLLLARMVQDGYICLLKELCPGVEKSCTDPGINKLLQLITIYKTVFNLTIEASQNYRQVGEVAENEWFENNLPLVYKKTFCLSILPSRAGKSAIPECANYLTRYFYSLKPGKELENFIGYDEVSEKAVNSAHFSRVQEISEEIRAARQLADRLKTTSPWRALQKEERFTVILYVTTLDTFKNRVSKAISQRLYELAKTDQQRLEAILIELYFLQDANNQRPKDAILKVDELLVEAERNSCYELFEAMLLRYKAKHYLFKNQFDKALPVFRKAFKATQVRQYGNLRSEIAKECFALEVANQKVIPNNQEKYYRAMLYGNSFNLDNSEHFPTVEDIARELFTYFWEALYKPYSGITKLEPLDMDRIEKATNLLFIKKENWQDLLLKYIKPNRNDFKKGMRTATGETLLMSWIKMLGQLQKRLTDLECSGQLSGEDILNMEGFLGRMYQGIVLIAEHFPEQLNTTDFKKQSPLMLAAENNEKNLVKLFLKQGATPDLGDFQGRTALHSAIRLHHQDIAELLMGHACTLDKSTIDGQTVMHTAVRSGNQPALAELLSRRPELVQKRNSHKQTALEYIEFLLNNPTALINHNENPEHRKLLKTELEEMVVLIEAAVFSQKHMDANM